MYLGRVIGCVWSSVKHRDLEGQRLLIVQPLTPELQNTGRRIVCTDCTGAGAGEMIYWVRGKEASFPFLPKEPPTDTTIVGIVDSLTLPRQPGAGNPEPAGANAPRAKSTAKTKKPNSRVSS